MEVVQHRWRLRWSFKNATIVVTLFNLIASLFLLHSIFSSSSSKTPSSVERYIKEAEEIRRAMLPVELIKRVKEIRKEAYGEPDPVQQKDAKQTAAVDLISRLNNYRSYSDSGSVKALGISKREICAELNGIAIFSQSTMARYSTKALDLREYSEVVDRTWFVSEYPTIFLEEWRKRKMERARQRELEKNGTTI